MNIPRSIWVILWLDSDRFHRSSGTRHPSRGTAGRQCSVKEFWYAPSRREARREWCQLAIGSGLQPWITFTNRPEPYLAGVSASARYHLHTSVLEGVNNRIKVIERIAYGYRESEYSFLKIKAPFPGKAR